VQIAEDRFDDAEASAVQQSPFTAVDSGFHRGGLRVQVFGFAAVEEGDLSIRADVRLAQALHSEGQLWQRAFVPSKHKKNRDQALRFPSFSIKFQSELPQVLHHYGFRTDRVRRHNVLAG